MRPADPSAAIAAATLVVMRDRDTGPPELLMIERAAAMSFAGGALVFPGGRVDPGDRLLADGPGGDDDDRSARIAAIRETIEETGVAVGLVPAPSPALVAAVREGLAAGKDFGGLLAQAKLAVDPRALVFFARWRPGASGPRRRFDTRFYLARGAADAVPSPDGAETAAASWMAAGDALAAARDGAARIIFPTRCNLERLARFASYAEAAADAAHHPAATITPRIEQRDGEDWLCIPEGFGYPVTAQRMAEAVRG